MENYFCDGSTFRTDANQHKMVWKKNAERYKEVTVQKCRELFKQIDELNVTEEKQYGTCDLEEHSGSSSVTSEEIAAQVAKLNETIKTVMDKKLQRKAKSRKKR